MEFLFVILFPVFFSLAVYLVYSIKKGKGYVYLLVAILVTVIYLLGILYVLAGNNEYNSIIFSAYVFLMTCIGVIALTIAVVTRKIFIAKKLGVSKLTIPILVFVLILLFIYWFITKGVLYFY